MTVITLRQLRYFDALASARHFGRAAELVGVTQPALSMQIKDMEDMFGGKLLERSAAGTELTELGRVIAERARAILASVRDLDDLAKSQDEPLGGALRVGIIPSVAPYLLPRLLGRAAREFPRLQITVRETVTRVLAEELARGELDAVIASLPLGHGDFAEEPAFEDHFLLAAPAGSSHAGRSPALAELIDTGDLLLLEDGHCLRDQALAVCKAIDPRRLRSFGATSLATILQLVAAGQGVTLVPRLALDSGQLLDPRLALIPFAAPAPRRTIGLAWRRTSPRGRDYRALAELVRAACGDERDGSAAA
jgi:LysR family hydrogen peroxide-inducible transcriptional activator